MFQLISLIAITLLVGTDLLTKYIIIHSIKIDGPKEVLFGTFRLAYVENTGAAFSSFSQSTAMLTLFTALVIFLCLFVLLTRKTKSKVTTVGLVLVIAGGIGNAFDRIKNGFVVDFIDPTFVKFAVFNVADIFVTVGAALIITYEIYELIKEKRNKGSKNDGKNKYI